MAKEQLPATVAAAQAAGWFSIDAHCATCRLIKVTPLSFVARHAADVTLQDAVRRFRCQRCGARPASASLNRTLPGIGYGQPRFEHIDIP